MILYYNIFNQNFQLAKPFTPFISINLLNNFSKMVKLQEGERQATNEEGQLLFLKTLYEEHVSKIKVGEEITTEVTEIPYMEKIQKKNSEGKLLYIQYIYNEDGEIIDSFETTKKLDSNGLSLKPCLIEVQQTTANGDDLFIKYIYQEELIKTPIGTEITTEVTSTPQLEPNMVDVELFIFDYPQYFNLDDVYPKYEEQLASEYCYEKVSVNFLDNISRDFVMEGLQANIGHCFLELPPKTSIKLNTINVENPTKFNIKLDCENGVELFYGSTKLREPNILVESKVNMKFVNTTDEPKRIYSLVVGFNKIENPLEVKVAELEDTIFELQGVIDELILGGS